MIDSNGRFPEILLFCLRNISKSLRISVYERKPAALDLNHDTMTWQKLMGNLIEFKAQTRLFAWFEGFRVFIALSKFPPEHISPHHSFQTRGQLFQTVQFFFTTPNRHKINDFN